MALESEEMPNCSNNQAWWRKTVERCYRIQSLTEEVDTRTPPFFCFTVENVALSIPKICHSINIDRNIAEELKDDGEGVEVQAIRRGVKTLGTKISMLQPRMFSGLPLNLESYVLLFTRKENIQSNFHQMGFSTSNLNNTGHCLVISIM